MEQQKNIVIKGASNIDERKAALTILQDYIDTDYNQYCDGRIGLLRSTIGYQTDLAWIFCHTTATSWVVRYERKEGK